MQYWLWRVVSAVVARIPARAGYLIAFVVGTIGYYTWPRGRRSMHANYRRVLEGASEHEIGRVARRSLVNYCRYLADFIRFPSLSAPVLAESVHGAEEFKRLDSVLEKGKGALIVCMHFGNWDLGAGGAAARGYPLTVVAESFADPRLDSEVLGSRRRLGMQVVKMEKAGPSLLRALKQNGLLALLIDRPMHGEGGVRVKFFGEEVEVPAGPARLALRSGAAIIPAAFARSASTKIEVQAMTEPPILAGSTGDEQRDVQRITQEIMSAHERFIREYPDQWYMFRELWPREEGKAQRNGNGCL